MGGRARRTGAVHRKAGDDDVGRLARARLEARGVEVAGPSDGRGGVDLLARRPRRRALDGPDRGAAVELRPDELEPAWLDGCDQLFVSGYALLASRRGRRRSRAVELARGTGARSASTSPPGARSETRGADAVPRRCSASSRPTSCSRTRTRSASLGGRCPERTWILKRGARGCSFDGDERAALPVEQVVDTTGAGDALAAGWIVGGPDLALEAAARCVARLGSMP